MGLEALLVASLLLALFRLRGLFGLAPIHTTLGVFYQMATLLAASVYVRVGPDMMMSPGSVILFPSALFAVLFIYIREDAEEARRLMYALVAANLVVGALGLLVTQHLQSPLVFNPLSLPADLFIQQPRLLMIGTLTLLADTILIILVYEYLHRPLGHSLFLRIYASMALVLVFDTCLFVTGSFYELPHYRAILISGIVGKVAVALLYAAVLTIYLKRFDIPASAPNDARPELRDLFHLLTYREKYEALQAQSHLDPLTGVFHRGFLNAMLAKQSALATRTSAPMTLLMIDVDRFKEVNDQFGHAEGDLVLMVIADALKRSVRAADIVCRYGGEEFAVLLPNTPQRDGTLMAERMRAEVAMACYYSTNAGTKRHISVTIGVASLPSECQDAEDLIRLADERLYEGKRAGRDRVVTGANASVEGVALHLVPKR